MTLGGAPKWRLVVLKLLTVLTLLMVASSSSQFHEHAMHSTAFTYGSFCCPSSPCPAGITMLHSAYAHMVVGNDHESILPLLMHRICDFFKQCIDKRRIRIVLHNNDQPAAPSKTAATPGAFLDKVGVKYMAWNGTFTADAKMAKSFESLRGIHAHDTVILQMDVDEEPELDKFNQALRELEAQQCDAVFAYWQDRLAPDGNLSQVLLSASMQEQFPLKCDLSGKVVKGGKTTKTIAYRADSRLDGGQHDVWCDRSTGRGAWNKTAACARHAHERAKSKLLPLIYANVPNLQSRPRYCPSKVPLRHYKFVLGVTDYLQRRMNSYRRLGLHWWKDSKLFLGHIREHGGRVCVDCKGMRCVDTLTGQVVRERAAAF